MATTKEFHDYVIENLRRAGAVSSRRMMGEYLVYFQNKLVGMICDNCFFLKPTASVLRHLPQAEMAYPYEGCKSLMVVVEEVEEARKTELILQDMYDELPAPKPKKEKRKSGEGKKEK